MSRAISRCNQRQTECFFPKETTILTFCQEYLCDLGILLCGGWDIQLWPQGPCSLSCGPMWRWEEGRKIRNPGRLLALRLLALRLQPSCNAVGDPQGHRAGHPSPQPWRLNSQRMESPCPELQRGRGIFLCWLDEWMDEGLAPCMQCIHSAYVS